MARAEATQPALPAGVAEPVAVEVALVDNDPVIVLALALGLPLPLGLAVLTGLGSRRRGAGPVVTVLSAVFFPFAWVVWYVHDVHPYRHRRAAQG